MNTSIMKPISFLTPFIMHKKTLNFTNSFGPMNISVIATMTLFVSGLLSPTFAQESSVESVNNEQVQQIEQVMDESVSNSPFNPQTPIELVRGDELPFMNARFSPDGEHIAFTGPNYFGLWVADYNQQDSINVSNMRKLTSVQAGFGYDWSLDGEWILSTHHVYRDRKKMSALQLYGTEVGEVKRLTDYSMGYQGDPEWMGYESLAVISSRNGLVSAETGVELPERLKPAIPDDRNRLFIMDEKLVRLSENNSQMNPVEVFEDEDAKLLNLVHSPDGKLVAFERYGDGLYLMNSNGENLRFLGKAYRASWSPDSRYIVAMETQDNGYAFTAAELVVFGVNEPTRVEITRNTDLITLNPSWSPYGDSILFNDPETGHIYLLPLR
jgi:hypothetical protein